MKSRILPLILVIVLCSLTISCADKTGTPQITAINGAWNLKSVRGGLGGVNDTYSTGQIVWTFDDTTNVLTIANNIPNSGPIAGFDSGTYSYEFRSSSNGDFIFIDNVNKGAISFSINLLVIDDGLASNGFITEFER